MDFNTICPGRNLPRPRHEIQEDLKALLDIHCMTATRFGHIWTLINELEESAWHAGADEGYDAAKYL